MNDRTITIAVSMLALVVIIFIAATGFDPFGWRKGLKGRAVSAETQAAVETKTAAITVETAAKTIVIHRITQGATQYVQAQPGATDALPPAVALAVRACLDRLRVEPQAGGDQPGCDVPGAVR